MRAAGGGDPRPGPSVQMAQIAVKYASTAIFTSETRATTSPEAISTTWPRGTRPRVRYRVSPTGRGDPHGCDKLRPGDIPFRGGKGPRDLPDRRRRKPPDDREEVRKAFRKH